MFSDAYDFSGRSQIRPGIAATVSKKTPLIRMLVLTTAVMYKISCNQRGL
jgi:hypothetical protein